MKKFLQEFKIFALKGNVMDLAVGMIIGSAFTAIVTALTTNFIQPIIDFITRKHPEFYTKAELLGFLSAFISAVINFLIIAMVLFLLIKAMNKIMSIGKKKSDEVVPSPTTKICPFCKSEIAIDATRCAHCTSELPE